MKAKYILYLILINLALSQLLGYKNTIFNGQISAQQVQIVLQQPPPNKLGIADLWRLTLINSGQTPLSIYLEGTVDESNDGRILDARSQEFELAIGTKTFNAGNFSSASVNFKNNRYQEVIIRTGNAPAGNYSICLTARDSKTNEVVGAQTCIIQNIQNISPPELISPADGEEVNSSWLPDTLPHLIFNWTPVFSQGTKFTYRLTLVEIIGNQSVNEAMQNNKPLFVSSDLDITTLVYPKTAANLNPNTSYGWGITVLNNNSFVVQSEYRRFAISGWVKDTFRVVKKEFTPVLSSVEVELDRIIYPEGVPINAKLINNSMTTEITKLALLFISSDGTDIEEIKLVRSEIPNEYILERPLPVKINNGNNAGVPNDGYLSLKPNEMFFAIYFPKDVSELGRGGEADMVTDFGLLEDKNFTSSPFEIIPELAMTDDEKIIPEGGKKIGTMTTYKGIPVQIPVNEIVFYPKNEQQLKRFLDKTNGQVIMSNTIKNDNNNGTKDFETAYLVKVNTDNVRAKDFGQIRTLMQKTDRVYFSNEDAVKITTYCMELKLDGYVVDVNPRLQFAGSNYYNNISGTKGKTNLTSIPSFADPNIGSNLINEKFNIPKVWSYMSLWDVDTREIPIAIIDQGFCSNPDFGNILNEYDYISRRWGRGVVNRPSDVGASLFGDRMWHGNGVVTTALGVVNDGYGSAGTGGLVGNPLLFNVGLREYAFEIGNAIILATNGPDGRPGGNDGASIINISAGYPCRIVTNILGWSPGICSAGERFDACAAITAVLNAAVYGTTTLLCAGTGLVPIFGQLVCAAGTVVSAVTLTVSIGACLGSLAAGELWQTMQHGVNYATEHGVTVVSISGNKFMRTSLPEVIRDIVDTDSNNMSIDRWQVIPGVLPGVICVGAVGPNFPYENQHYFGNRVDIWAPLDGNFFNPRTVNECETSQELSGYLFGGTSAAAPYISGLIANMQALNPDLDPRRTSRPLAELPRRIRDLLVNNAYTGTDVPTARISFSNNRRNIVNPWATILAATPDNIRNFITTGGYDNSVGFDETGLFNNYDWMLEAKVLTPESPEYTGTIVTIRPKGPNGREFTDSDYVSVTMPRETGIYGNGELQIKMPSVNRYGNLHINDIYYNSSTDPLNNETTIRIAIPPMYDGARYTLKIGGKKDLPPRGVPFDNVYKITYIPVTRLGNALSPDRFDRQPLNNNFISTPVELNNTNGWIRDASGGDNYIISVIDLNFHGAYDVDCFRIPRLPQGVTINSCSNCMPFLRISTLHNGQDVPVSISVLNETGESGSYRRIINRGTTPLELTCDQYLNAFPLIIELEGNGQALSYDLRITWDNRAAELCHTANTLRSLSYIRGLDINPLLPIIFNPDLCPQCNYKFDNMGRITNPAMYFFNWENNGDFNLTGSFAENQSMAIELLDMKGNVITGSVTKDLTAFYPNLIVANTQDESVLMNINATNLPIGTYFLAFNYVTPGEQYAFSFNNSAGINNQQINNSYLVPPMFIDTLDINYRK